MSDSVNTHVEIKENAAGYRQYTAMWTFKGREGSLSMPLVYAVPEHNQLLEEIVQLFCAGANKKLPQ